MRAKWKNKGNFDFPFLSKTDVFDNRTLPFGGILFYFSFFWSFSLILRKDSKSIFYLNYITYCKTHKIFNELVEYMNECLDRADIKFDNLFSNLEHRINDNKFNEISLEEDDNETNIELSI